MMFRYPFDRSGNALPKPLEGEKDEFKVKRVNSNLGEKAEFKFIY